ncbi:MAG: ATP-dependent DNA helicase RecG [Spirochaetales bacterium]|nr:ATP-dependent DNA helicase RecG [Spirochaetales bacterium]
MFLRELSSPVSELPGCGPALVKRLSRLGVFRAADLLLLPPRDYEDRAALRLLSAFGSGPVNCPVNVLAHDWFGFGRMRTLKVWVEDDEGTRAALVCFNRPFLEKSLPVGARLRLFGRFEWRFGELQSSAFDAERVDTGDAFRPAGVLPVYPLTEGLGQASVRKLVRKALELWGRVDDELPHGVIQKRSLARMADALRLLHRPASPDDAALARRTLAYTELFYLQIMIGRRSLARREEARPTGSVDTRLACVLEERLPFSLTEGQKAALADIAADMAGPWPMARLLQGDVGSGKTLVAFMAALYAIAGGGQAAIMAPTELLARQHADTAARLLEPLGVRLAFLSGNVADAARKPLLSALASGDIDLVVGTHALFSADVVFRTLRLVVVDEQHRFGVLQRLAMGSKGSRPDMLMMSATPIPRTLALTVYGDLAVSTITTLPPGRLPVITHLARMGNEAKVYDFVRRELEAGRRAYFVYPLVDRSDRVELKDAVAMYERLSREVFPEFKGGIIHSRVPEADKRATMADFAAGKLSFLVATSVVEVGVDVPEASCMVIEHAERFGLAALHQLRGRVGRGKEQSYCFLVWSDGLGDEGKRRVMAMKDTTDGFLIAEEDLRMRGPGQITGTGQSGQLELSFADPVRDAELLEAAREDAQAILAEDPGLLGADGSVIRAVLERASPFAERTAATG